jgi:hypothetical protein
MNKTITCIWVSALFVGSLHAQIANITSISLVASVQNVSSDKLGSTVTLPAVQHRTANKELLAIIAKDLGTSFPTGSQLAIISSGTMDGYFAVVDRQRNKLVDLSNIMQFSTGNNQIYSGKVNNLTGVLSQKASELGVITFDDSAMSASPIQFKLQGLLTGTLTQTLTATTQTATMASGTGEGSYQSIPMIVTGTMSLRGKAQ